ncbi:hypothetical protein BYT27DRAFT_6641085 [Phlegmacium glaucopus]|nr:hypothetical protein BYT27DRAFT_6641085 [Phlegmacium glaucopus]
MPKFGSEPTQEPRTERTEPSVQVQFSSVQDFWTVGPVLGSHISKILRTGFEPVRTELSAPDPMFLESESEKSHCSRTLSFQQQPTNDTNNSPTGSYFCGGHGRRQQT